MLDWTSVLSPPLFLSLRGHGVPEAISKQQLMRLRHLQASDRRLRRLAMTLLGEHDKSNIVELLSLPLCVRMGGGLTLPVTSSYDYSRSGPLDKSNFL
jgi:hypothetical protein